MKKNNKEKIRSKRWSKRICIKEDQHKFIEKEKNFLGYKTIAGTLDMIINFYKKNK